MNEFRKIFRQSFDKVEDIEEGDKRNEYETMSYSSNIFTSAINNFDQDESDSSNQQKTSEISDLTPDDFVIEENKEYENIIPQKVYGPDYHKKTKNPKNINKIDTNKEKKETQPQKESVNKGKDSTKKKVHTKYFPDNSRNKCGSALMKVIYDALDKRCRQYNPYLKLSHPNFEKQFGYNCNQHLRFIEARIYQIFGYNSESNKNIIRIMTEERNDEVFIFLMKCKFEYLFNDYIEGKNIIKIDENDFSLTSFEEVVENKKQKLANKKKKQPQEEIEKEINDFINRSKSFINDIKGKGKLKKRPLKKPDFVLCDYDVKPEFE